MSGLTHLWQRFLLASSLLVGLFIGVAATSFAAHRRFSRPKRVALTTVAEPAASTAVMTNGGHAAAPTEPAP